MPDAYSVEVTQAARRELEALHDPLLARVLAVLRALSSNPRPAGCAKLVGRGSKYRVRIGDYRAIYTVDDTEKVVRV